jgi:hypothetical protein
VTVSGRVRLSDDALAMARRLGDRATLTQVLLERFFTIIAPATVAERRANADELLALASSPQPGTGNCRRTGTSHCRAPGQGPVAGRAVSDGS